MQSAKSIAIITLVAHLAALVGGCGIDQTEHVRTVEQLTAERDRADAQLTQARLSASAAQTERDNARSALRKLELALATSENDVVQLEGRLRQAREQIKELDGQLLDAGEARTDDLTKSKQAMEKLDDQIDKLDAELTGQMLAAAKLQEENMKLTGKLAELEAKAASNP